MLLLFKRLKTKTKKKQKQLQELKQQCQNKRKYQISIILINYSLKQMNHFYAKSNMSLFCYNVFFSLESEENVDKNDGWPRWHFPITSKPDNLLFSSVDFVLVFSSLVVTKWI